jgi:hypothetical protein
MQREMYMQEQPEANTEIPLIGMFATLRDGDLVCRRLRQVGIQATQFEIVDLTRLIAEFSPDLATRANLGTSVDRLSSKDNLAKKVGREIIDSSELKEYLYKAGVPEAMAPTYGERLRRGHVLVIVQPDRKRREQAENILYEASSVLNSSRGN